MMEVMIKKDGEFFKMSVESVLNGLEEQEEIEEVTVKYHPGIVSVVDRKDGFIVVVKEENINRVLQVRQRENIKLWAVSGVVNGMNNNLVSQLKELVNEVVIDGDLMYKTRKGVYVKFFMEKTSSGYIVDSKNINIGRSLEEMNLAESKFLFPNVYHTSMMCFGGVLPQLKGLQDVGKVATAFMSANANNDLAGRYVTKRALISMLEGLEGLVDNAQDKYRARLPELLGRLKSEIQNRPDGRAVINFYLLLVFANVFNLDMDWMQEKIYGI